MAKFIFRRRNTTQKFTFVQEQDSIAVVQCKTGIMQGSNGSDSLFIDPAADDLEHPITVTEVQRAFRLIQKEQFTLCHQSAG